jgi:hypothetical protein
VVVISAIFWVQSLAILIYMVLYLSYFYRVHNIMIHEIESRGIIEKIETSKFNIYRI